MFCVDAHQHFWRFKSTEYHRLQGDLAMLRRNFLPEELVRETKKAGVSGAVALQARQSIAETEWLLQLATERPLVLGVVGRLPLRG